MTLRLRCVRCGDLADMEPTNTRTRGLCFRCSIEGEALLAWDFRPGRFARWMARWQKGQERHPTYKALSAALEKLEGTPHGTLDEGTISVGEPDATDDVLAFVDTGA
jgi:hypothetical protein